MKNAEKETAMKTKENPAKIALDWVTARLDEGLTVYFATPLRVVPVKARNVRDWEGHGGLFKINGESLFIRRGQKNWDCVDGCRITAE